MTVSPAARLREPIHSKSGHGKEWNRRTQRKGRALWPYQGIWERAGKRAKMLPNPHQSQHYKSPVTRLFLSFLDFCSNSFDGSPGPNRRPRGEPDRHADRLQHNRQKPETNSCGITEGHLFPQGKRCPESTNIGCTQRSVELASRRRSHPCGRHSPSSLAILNRSPSSARGPAITRSSTSHARAVSPRSCSVRAH